jgi:hypothetical protein
MSAKNALLAFWAEFDILVRTAEAKMIEAGNDTARISFLESCGASRADAFDTVFGPGSYRLTLVEYHESLDDEAEE